MWYGIFQLLTVVMLMFGLMYTWFFWPEETGRVGRKLLVTALWVPIVAMLFIMNWYLEKGRWPTWVHTWLIVASVVYAIGLWLWLTWPRLKKRQAQSVSRQ